jgi:hypothetical protein
MPELVRYAGYDPREAQRPAARVMARHRGLQPPQIRKPSVPTVGSALYYDRSLPRPHFSTPSDLVEADYIDAAAQDWNAADDEALPPRVRGAYRRRALRFEAAARRLTWTPAGLRKD